MSRHESSYESVNLFSFKVRFRVGVGVAFFGVRVRVRVTGVFFLG